MRKFIKLIAFGLAMASTSPAFAITAAPTDTISSLFLSGPQNYGFRVILSNPASLSGCTNGFAYINATDGNYEAYVSTLTSAYIAHKNVTLNYTIESGFCHISEFSVSG